MRENQSLLDNAHHWRQREEETRTLVQRGKRDIPLEMGLGGNSTGRRGPATLPKRSAGPRLPASTAPADVRPNDQLRRNATALPPHVTMSHTRYTVTPRSENSAGPEEVPGGRGVRIPRVV
jgi:hypothetical protein